MAVRITFEVVIECFIAVDFVIRAFDELAQIARNLAMRCFVHQPFLRSLLHVVRTVCSAADDVIRGMSAVGD